MKIATSTDTAKEIERRVVKEIDSMLLAYSKCEYADCEICAARDPFIRRLTKLSQRLKRKAKRK